MSRITNYEQILVQLKAQLDKTSKINKTERMGIAEKSARRRKSPIERLPEVLSGSSLSEHERHRALISALLADAFGVTAGFDPSMQTIVDQVTTQLRLSGEGRDLLNKALSEQLDGN